MSKKLKLLFTIAIAALFSQIHAVNVDKIGVVNSKSCMLESKYGKDIQEQLENMRKQWGSLLENTQKELKELDAKFEDQEYLDSLSPEKEEELKAKYKSLSEDMSKYQAQLSQVFGQAQYFYGQKLMDSISKAAEQIAQDNKLDYVVNQDTVFYYNPKMEVTKSVIDQMDKNFDHEQQEKKQAAEAEKPVTQKKEEPSKK